MNFTEQGNPLEARKAAAEMEVKNLEQKRAGITAIMKFIETPDQSEVN